MDKTISIGGDNLNSPMFHIRIKDNEIVGIDVHSDLLKCHFRLDQWAYDFYHYVKISRKYMNEIGLGLINNKDNWDELNKLHDKLFKLRQRHFEDNFDEKGVLSLRNYHYEVIAYRCCPNIKRSLKTVYYINQLLGVYANFL